MRPLSIEKCCHRNLNCLAFAPLSFPCLFPSHSRRHNASAVAKLLNYSIKIAHGNKPLSLPQLTNSKSDAAALDALSTLLLRRHLSAAVGASCAAVALRLAARLCSGPPLAGASAVDVAIALARLVEVVPHVAR